MKKAYRFPAILKKTEKGYRIEFPDLRAAGYGFDGYNDSVDFAENLLFEILLYKEKRGKEIPAPGRKEDYTVSGGKVIDVKIDYDAMKKEAESNAGKNAYGEETAGSEEITESDEDDDETPGEETEITEAGALDDEDQEDRQTRYDSDYNDGIGDSLENNDSDRSRSLLITTAILAVSSLIIVFAAS